MTTIPPPSRSPADGPATCAAAPPIGAGTPRYRRLEEAHPRLGARLVAGTRPVVRARDDGEGVAG